MQVRLQIQRSDPVSGETRLQLYELEARREATLLDCLEQIKDEQDGTLAFRRSCREGICGSCAVRIDGRTALACRTPVAELVAGGRLPVIAPIGNLPVVRDLVVELEPIWQKLRAVEPFLRPTSATPADGRETVVQPARLEAVRKEALCINCGACVSECDALSVSPEFLGPHALAKAWRLVGDPREEGTRARLKRLSGEHGIWECTRCYLCNERCPKGVDPLGAIAKLGAEAFAAGVTRDRGARHARWFVTSARTTGWLRESELVVRTLGIAASVGKIPLALRLFRRGKAPLPLPRHKANELAPARELRRIVAGQDRRGARGIVQAERVLERIELVRAPEQAPPAEWEDF
jgi:succinate dehydrogenase / fumarate reductase iron-sulfur subunit